MKHVAIAIALAFASISASPRDIYLGSLEEWSVGDTHETQDGEVYVTLLAQQYGWRVWEWERSHGNGCVATKAAEGHHSIYPLIGTHFTSVGPSYGLGYIKVRTSGSRMLYGWSSPSLSNSAASLNLRKDGDRFWTNVGRAVTDEDLEPYGEGVVEVKGESYTNPTLRWDHQKVEVTGRFDLKGLAWAKKELRACHALATSEVCH